MSLAVQRSVLNRGSGLDAGERIATVVARSSPMSGATELIVSSPMASAVRPGEFFQIAVGAPGTLLRRPYSAAWADRRSGQIGFIFNVVGSGSAWLAGREPGEQLDLVGPLGRGFRLEGSRPAICVAAASASPFSPASCGRWSRVAAGSAC